MNNSILKKGAILLLFFLIIGSSVFAQNWLTNINKAKQLATAENKTIILVFSGSDWCAPCIKLEKEIWESETFKAYAKAHYVMQKAEFPRKKKNQPEPELLKQNKKLAEKYNPKGYFPFVVILDKNGKVLGETGYKKMTPDAYIQHLNSFIQK